MALTPVDCNESENLYAGDTAWSDACVLDIVRVLNDDEVSVKVYPLYEGKVDLIMRDGQIYNFVDFIVPFQIRVKYVFHTDTSKFAKFILCDLVEPSEPEPEPEPTLYVSRITSGLEPTENLPMYDRYGVNVQVTITGTGVGNLKIDWGSDYDEVFIDVVEGIASYEHTLPVGVHTVCAELFNIELSR